MHYLFLEAKGLFLNQFTIERYNNWLLLSSTTTAIKLINILDFLVELLNLSALQCSHLNIQMQKKKTGHYQLAPQYSDLIAADILFSPFLFYKSFRHRSSRTFTDEWRSGGGKGKKLFSRKFQQRVWAVWLNFENLLILGSAPVKVFF